MLDLRLGRCALGIGLAVAMLAGCGGAQTTSSAMPQGVTTTTQRQQDGRSWMLPKAKGGDLLYVGSPASDDVYVYKYPSGEMVGTLTGFDNPLGLCSDTKGNVWITNAVATGSTYLVEYAHGGTTAIAKLDDPGFSPQACSVNATTGNLAVGNQVDDVAVWRNARGKRRLYLTSCCVFGPETITYDGSDNVIFADWTTRNGWLPKGDAKVRKFKLRPPLSSHGPFQWDGRYLGILVFSRKQRREEVIRYNVSGGMASQIGIVPLNGVTGVTTSGQFWIQGSGMVFTDSRAGDVYFFNYPRGGNPTKTISGLDDPYGITISVGPSD